MGVFGFFFIMNIICDGSHRPRQLWSLLAWISPLATHLLGSQNPSTDLVHRVAASAACYREPEGQLLVVGLEMEWEWD